MKGSVQLHGVVKRHGTTTVLHGVDLAIEPGEFFVLLGPSGSGKTTTLRILAGLEAVSDGRVLMDGTDVTLAEPGERDVAMVFQSYALYPHMTVAQNIAFPLKMVGTDPAQIQRAVTDAAAKVSIGHLLARTPGQLSGGQQQRVALARAIVRSPRLFLLDEPLSNLDAKLRLETRLELHSLQRSLGVTTVYVTHDQEEAMTLADRIAVLQAGRIEQFGAPLDLYANPANLFVAGFIGSPAMNFLPGTLRRAGGQASVQLADGTALPAPAGTAGDDGQPVIFGTRPEHLSLGSGGGIPTQVVVVEPTGADTFVSCRHQGSELSVVFRERHAFAPGSTIHLQPDLSRAHLFDAQSGRRLAA
jgi:multiple sugar transport system ATP-binding protein